MQVNWKFNPRLSENFQMVAKQGDNVVVVNSEADLPPAVAGIITLEANTFYDFNGNTITLTDELHLPNACILLNVNLTMTKEITILASGVRFTNYFIIYTGVNTLFNAVDSGLSFRLLLGNIYAPNGTVFDIDNTVNGFVVLDNMLIIACANVGQIQSTNLLLNVVVWRSMGDGLTVTDGVGTNIRTLQIEGVNNAINFVEFDGTTQGSISIETINATMGTNEKCFCFNTGTTFGGVSVSSCIMSHQDRVFSAICYDQKTLGFKFIGNTLIPDSKIRGNIFFQENAVETVIDQVLVPVKVNATYETGYLERFTNGDSLTYIGEDDVILDAICTMVLRPASGVNILLGGYIALTHVEIYTVTFTNATDIVNIVAHGLTNDTSIRFSNSGGALPAEIRDDQFYWVINKNDDDFQVSRTKGGTVYQFTDDGTGTNSYSLGEYIDSSEGNATPSSSRPFSVAPISPVALETGDKVELFVDNHDTTANIIVSSAQLINS